MPEGAESNSFLSFLTSIDLRFLQERRLGLDLYHSGLGGQLTLCLGVAAATVFLLSIFHVIVKRRQIAGILLGLGVCALVAGGTTTWWHFRELETPETWPGFVLESIETDLVRDDGGTLPVTTEQQAAVLALPALTAVVVASGCIAGTLYLSLFWGASLLPSSQGGTKTTGARRSKRRSH